MTVLNVVLLILAVVTLHIAVASYHDSQESGRKQEESARTQQAALDASRKALLGVLENLTVQQVTLNYSKIALQANAESAVQQQKLLQVALRTSQNQLRILDAQWKRELEQPDMGTTLVYPARPAIVVRNESKIKPVRDGLYSFTTLNLSRWDNNKFQMVVTASTKVDFIAPGGSYLPKSLELILDPVQPLTKGDRLFGYVTSGCADCRAERLYWVLIEFGVRGWFKEVTASEADRYSLSGLAKLTPSTVEERLRQFLSETGLVEMPTRLW